MPRYQITAPDGRVVTVEGESAPTEQDAAGIFASLPAKQVSALADQATARGGIGFSDPSQVQPNAEQLLREREAIGVRNKVRRDKENFIRNNVLPGVPLDIEAELPAGQRAKLSFESNIDKQVEHIGKMEGVLGARKSKDGQNVIVKVSGDDGKEREILLHPFGPLRAGDVAGATAPILKTGAMTGAALATGGMSLLPTAGVLGGTAAGLEAISSGGSRVLSGQDIDAPELALAAGKEGVINAALPLAGAAVSKGVTMTGNALRRGVGELERRLPIAANRLGVDTTVTETTGSPLLAKVGKLTPAEEAERQARLGMAKDRAIGPSGPSTVLAESEIADQTQPIFAAAEQASQKGVRADMSAAETAAHRQIQAELDSGLVPTTRTTSEVGDFIRNKIASKAADSKTTELRQGAEKLYGAANALAEKEGIEVAPKALTALRKDLDADTHKALVDFAPGIKRIPALEALLTEEKAVDTGLVDAAGRKIINVVAPEPLTVKQARELRSVVYEMAHSPGPPGEGGVPRRYLTRLYKALDDDLAAAVKSGSPELQNAHSAADDFYKSKIQPLQQSDVAKLFLETDAAGRMGGDEIVRRLFRGGGNLDALRAYRDVLGKDSPEWKLLVRQGMQTVIEDASAGSARINAGTFMRRIDDLSKSELADEIIGPIAKSLRADSRLMARAQGVNIPEAELEDALAAAPGKVGKLLESAIAREEQHNQTYNSSIQKQLRDGVLGPRTMGNVDDFVTRFVENASTADVRQALTQIAAKDPAAVENIRQRVLKNILDRSRAPAPLGKATTGEVEDMSADKLVSLLDGNGREKYKAILGEKGVQFLDDLATYAEATAKRIGAEQGRKVAPETMAKEAGGAAIGLKRPIIGALVDMGATITGAKKLGGIAVRNPAVREFLETGKLPTFDRAVGNVGRALGVNASDRESSVGRLIFAAPQANEAQKALVGRPDN